jgi:hypothetical protein
MSSRRIILSDAFLHPSVDDSDISLNSSFKKIAVEARILRGTRIFRPISFNVYQTLQVSLRRSKFRTA